MNRLKEIRSLIGLSQAKFGEWLHTHLPTALCRITDDTRSDESERLWEQLCSTDEVLSIKAAHANA